MSLIRFINRNWQYLNACATKKHSIDSSEALDRLWNWKPPSVMPFSKYDNGNCNFLQLIDKDEIRGTLVTAFVTSSSALIKCNSLCNNMDWAHVHFCFWFILLTVGIFLEHRQFCSRKKRAKRRKKKKNADTKSRQAFQHEYVTLKFVAWFYLIILFIAFCLVESLSRTEKHIQMDKWPINSSRPSQSHYQTKTARKKTTRPRKRRREREK